MLVQPRQLQRQPRQQREAFDGPAQQGPARRAQQRAGRAVTVGINAAPDQRARDDQQTGLLERLTPRESEVLTYLSKGFTIKEIASLMGIKWFTVNDHIKSIYKKLNVSSRAEAAVLASKQGLV